MEHSLKTLVRRTQTGDYEFIPELLEIAVLDRLGKLIWKSSRPQAQAQIRWDGRNTYGEMLEGGSYLFKAVGPDRKEHYIPFIHGN